MASSAPSWFSAKTDLSIKNLFIMSEHEAEGEEEEQAPEPQEWESFIIHPEHIEAFWLSPRPKEAMIEHYQKTFNPENKLDEEKLDYNELNIVAEF